MTLRYVREKMIQKKKFTGTRQASSNYFPDDIHNKQIDISSMSLLHVQALFTSCELMMMSAVYAQKYCQLYCISDQ